jgi:hypothetical protein
VLAAGLALQVGCAGPSAPWHVPAGQEARFAENRQVCRQLTDARDGSPVPERFATCMERRGWRHQRFYERWLGN